MEMVRSRIQEVTMPMNRFQTDIWRLMQVIVMSLMGQSALLNLPKTSGLMNCLQLFTR